jgi:hypothetical protein
MPSGRVLSISPIAATQESAVPGARVLSVSPNAEPAARPGQENSGAQDASPPTRQAEQNQAPAGPPTAQSAPTPQPQTPDRDSFARDILRGLEP